MSTKTESIQSHRMHFKIPFQPQHSKTWTIVGGVITCLIGAIALFAPVLFGIGATIALGVMLTVAAVFQFFHAIQNRYQHGLVLNIVASLLTLAAGLIMWFNPLAGLISLGVLLTVYFMVTGLFRMTTAFALRPVTGWGVLFSSGLLTTVLGLVIWSQISTAGLMIFGVVLGIDLLMIGISQIAAASDEP